MIDHVPDHATAVARAQALLGDACGDLDAAVMCLADDQSETVMANVQLVSLLLRVTGARRHLKDLEGSASASLPSSLR